MASDQFPGFVVNKTLFTGSSTGTGSAGNKLSVTFTNNGRITGWAGFTKYHAVTDILNDCEWDYYDEMYVTARNGKSIRYAFAIAGNQLLLYKLRETTQGQMVRGL
jgi:hypothetical protein